MSPATPANCLSATATSPSMTAARRPRSRSSTGATGPSRGQPLSLLRGQPRSRVRPCRGLGKRLDLPAGASARFDPGEHRPGDADRHRRKRRHPGVQSPYRGQHQRSGRPGTGSCPGPGRADSGGLTMATMTRERYAALFGPTTGDRIRLGDTSLLCPHRTRPRHPWRGRDHGPRQDPACDAGIHGGLRLDEGALETVFCNVVVMCPVGGIYKADVGVRDGRIHAIGKAGNPAFMAGVSPGMVIGPEPSTSTDRD